MNRVLRQLIGCEMPKLQTLNERIKESVKLDAPFQHFSTVTIGEYQGKDHIIRGIGQSKRNNLILDNFGNWLASFFRQPANGITSLAANNTDLAAKTWHLYREAAAAITMFNRKHPAGALNIGTMMEVGSGTTAATRADEQIDTNFIVAPEDDSFATGAGSYVAGAISVAGAITSGGAGTVNETLMIGAWGDSLNAAEELALFRDVLAAGESFVLGNTITVTYTINL